MMMMMMMMMIMIIMIIMIIMMIIIIIIKMTKKLWVFSPFSRGFQYTKACIIWIMYK
jgi:hypothetical protein